MDYGWRPVTKALKIVSLIHKPLDIYFTSPILVVLWKPGSSLAENIEIQMLFKETQWFSSTFQDKIHFQGLFQTPLHFEVLFKPVQTLYIQATKDQISMYIHVWPVWSEISLFACRMNRDNKSNSLWVQIHSDYSDRHAWENSVDQDQIPFNGECDQGLHYLPPIQ